MKLFQRIYTPLGAYVAPLFVFLILSALLTEVANIGGWTRNHPDFPWYRQDSKLWIYPLQTLVGGGLIIFYRKFYRWNFQIKSVFYGVATGLAGIAFWLLPSWLFNQLALENFPSWLRYLGFASRSGEASLLFEYPLLMALRWIRLVIVVAFVEEIFWRGFLMRYINPKRLNWRLVPFGIFSWKSYLIVTLAVVLIHQPADYLGALIYGSLAYLLAVKTKSLGACVVMHAVANACLGIYVIVFKQHGLW